MSVSSILEARRLDTTNSPTGSYEDERRAKVQAAVELIQVEINRLRRLEKRDEDRRRARSEVAEITALALRKAALREAKRHLMITISRDFFHDLGTLALKSVHDEAYTALHKELTRLWERQE